MKKCATGLVLTLTCLNSALSLVDADISQTNTAPSSRFLLDKKGEAYDQATRLTWLRCSADTQWKD